MRSVDRLAALALALALSATAERGMAVTIGDTVQFSSVVTTGLFLNGTATTTVTADASDAVFLGLEEDGERAGFIVDPFDGGFTVTQVTERFGFSLATGSFFEVSMIDDEVTGAEVTGRTGFFEALGTTTSFGPGVARVTFEGLTGVNGSGSLLTVDVTTSDATVIPVPPSALLLLSGLVALSLRRRGVIG